MDSWIARLASLKISITLLAVIVVAMAAGTLVESARGSDSAIRAIYGAFWFRLLLAALGLNIFFSIIDRFPWSRQQVGFVITHAAVLVVLTGSFVTEIFKQEGQLALWEGETSARVMTGPAEDQFLILPFALRLESFEIDKYPGTQRPAMFRSRVVVSDASLGRETPAIIEMNRELSYGGYKFFQSSYELGKEKDRTILAVSRDPGQPIVFLGYILLLAGMLVVLATRIAQRRGLAAERGRGKLLSVQRVAVLLLGLGLAGAAAAPPAMAASVPAPATVEKLRRVPVQHDGRIMPIDTMAREAVMKVTGAMRWQGIDPAALALGWTFDPIGWSAEPILKVPSELAAETGLSLPEGRASFSLLASHPRVLALFERARHEDARGVKLPPLLREASDLEDRLLWMQGFFSGRLLAVIPAQPDPSAPWSAPAHLHGPEDLLAHADTARAMGLVAAGAMERELTYNRVRPSRLSWWILLPATLVSLLAWVRRSRWSSALAIVLLLAGTAVMTWGLAARWMVAGRIPASNMYESLLFLGWGVGFFALIAASFLGNRLVIFNASAMAALTMVLADCLPIDPFIHPMPPVLSGTAWLAIHVPIIMVSYSVLALGVLVAHLQVAIQAFAPARRPLVLHLNDTLYWYMHVGSILLLAGIISGSVWAASSWGRYWGWDPKEVWSLIAFLVYLGILHGRLDKILGLFGVAVVSIVAFWTIVMTYIGVNYILTAGLHSYGFGGSNVVRWLAVAVGVESVFLLTATLAHVTRSRQGAAPETMPA